MVDLKREYECNDCGLIYTLERINLVSGDPGDVLGNYCPNCASEDVSQDR